MVDIENSFIGLNLGFNNKIFISAPYNVVPRLDVKDPLLLVLDPSSHQTGIALGTESGELKLFIDFINKTCSLQEYKSYLNDYLSRLSNKYSISHLVYEVPFSIGGDIASEVLHSIEQTLSSYTRVISGLSKDKMFPILPGVWRKQYFSDKRYDGQRKTRDLLKKAALEEACLRYPQYEDYFRRTKYIPDSTDAIGIYHGFLMEYWYDYSRRIKRVSKVNSRYTKNQQYFSSVYTGNLSDLTALARSLNSTRSIDTFAFNSKLSITENCEIVTSQSNCINILYAVDKLGTEILKWEYDQPYYDNELLAVMCYRTHEKGN